MRDPRVVKLKYQVVPDEGYSYKNPDPLTFSNPLGEFTLIDGWLSVILTGQFPEEKTARQAVDPFLRSWEMGSDLIEGIGRLRFAFDHAEIIDRNPPKPGEPQIINPSPVNLTVNVTETVSAYVTMSAYPPPPKKFLIDVDTEIGYTRWLRYREGKESLLACAYFILTLIELSTRKNGKRNRAAKKYKIDVSILNKIGELSTERGDVETARKAEGLNQNLTSLEKEWLEKAIRKIVFRLGEFAAKAPLTEITLADLPEI